jgi:hypothetical protein
VLKEFRVSLETADGPRWFLVKAASVDAARSEAEEVAIDQGGQISGIDEEWEDDFDPGLHVDS